MAAYIPEPNVLALLVCEQIITDRLTAKQSLINMFTTIHAMRFPATHPQLCVYAALSDGRGKSQLTIRIVDGEEARPPLVQGTGIVEFKSPLAIANLALQFHGLVFPAPGDYRVQISSNNSLLREARLQLVQARPRPRDPRPPQAS